MSNVFTNHKVRRNVTLTLLFVVFINALSLIFWYFVKINPTLKNMEEIKDTIINEKIKANYTSFSDLEKELDNLSKDYDILYKITDEDNKVIKDINLKNNNMEYFSVFTRAKKELYIIDIYFKKNDVLVNLILSLIIFQIIIILILMISAYLLTGQSIIKPIERIINDIKNYKFGKKPTRKEINNELGVIQNELVNLVNSVEEEKQEQKRIIASISHDIKTPLTSIIGYTSLMKDNEDDKEIKNYSKIVYEKALHIKDILVAFDDYLVNYDNKKLDLTVVSVKDIIKELNDDYKIELNNKNIAFNITSDCENEKLNIDVLKIKRVFSNIISNSIKYVPKRGIINVTIKKKDNFIEFAISDNGVGVDEKILNKIFEPFYTTDDSRKISGLGLSICKEFIEIHKGTIKAVNNKGLTIIFDLPIYDKKE